MGETTVSLVREPSPRIPLDGVGMAPPSLSHGPLISSPLCAAASQGQPLSRGGCVGDSGGRLGRVQGHI